MPWDTGNIGFMLVSTSLVMLMTPGLAFFYGGLVGRKNVLTIMIQSFVSMGVTTVLWAICGYSMCFSGRYGDATNPDILGIIGNFNLAFFHGLAPTTPFAGSPTLPLVVFVAYQMMFAQITPALITGAFASASRSRRISSFLSPGCFSSTSRSRTWSGAAGSFSATACLISRVASSCTPRRASRRLRRCFMSGGGG
jgi:Amt family ammonium transporter